MGDCPTTSPSERGVFACEKKTFIELLIFYSGKITRDLNHVLQAPRESMCHRYCTYKDYVVMNGSSINKMGTKENFDLPSVSFLRNFHFWKNLIFPEIFIFGNIWFFSAGRWEYQKRSNNAHARAPRHAPNLFVHGKWRIVLLQAQFANRWRKTRTWQLGTTRAGEFNRNTRKGKMVSRGP